MIRWLQRLGPVPLTIVRFRAIEIYPDGLRVDGVRLDTMSAISRCQESGWGGADIVLQPGASPRARALLECALAREGIPVAVSRCS